MKHREGSKDHPLSYFNGPFQLTVCLLYVSIGHNCNISCGVFTGCRHPADDCDCYLSAFRHGMRTNPAQIQIDIESVSDCRASRHLHLHYSFPIAKFSHIRLLYLLDNWDLRYSASDRYETKSPNIFSCSGMIFTSSNQNMVNAYCLPSAITEWEPFWAAANVCLSNEFMHSKQMCVGWHTPAVDTLVAASIYCLKGFIITTSLQSTNMVCVV